MNTGLETPRATRGLSEVTAAILGGGLGTRLNTVIGDRQKVTAEVGGRPFLAYLLDQLAAAGMGHAVLCTGHLGSQVRETFGGSYAGLRLNYSQESSPLGTGGALRLAIPLLESESVLIMNGDSFCSVDLQDFWRRHSATDAAATLVLIEMSDTRRYGRVMVDAAGAVLSFEEKNEIEGPGWINAGMYLVNRHLLLTIPTSGPVSLEREILPAWIGRGLFGYRSEACFLDIGTPESYASAEEFFAQQNLL